MAQDINGASHKEYVEGMVDATNPGNIKNLALGFQSLPTPYGSYDMVRMALKSNFGIPAGLWRVLGFHSNMMKLTLSRTRTITWCLCCHRLYFGKWISCDRAEGGYKRT